MNAGKSFGIGDFAWKFGNKNSANNFPSPNDFSTWKKFAGKIERPFETLTHIDGFRKKVYKTPLL